MFTRKDFKVGLFVAVVCAATHRVKAGIISERRGTDERSVLWDQLLFVYTPALLCDQLVSRLADDSETDAVSCAAGIGTATITVTLKD